MEFHISRSARERYQVEDSLFSYTGNVVFADVSASRRLSQRMNEVRGAASDPKKAVHGAALFVMGLIDELSHAMIAQYREGKDQEVFGAAIDWFRGEDNGASAAALLKRVTEMFPNTPVFRGGTTAEAWLSETTDGIPNTQAAMEELVLLWLANVNPAFTPFKELVDDAPLAKSTIYPQVIAQLPAFFATRPPFNEADGSLLDVLLAPILASPDSLGGQLDFIRERWAPLLGEHLREILLAIDVLKEEEIAIWQMFHPVSPEQRRGRGGQKGWRDEGFVGDEFVGFGAGQQAYGTAQQPVMHEYEAFSPDQAWMPNVVLVAKSTYVWLEQLSKKYKRHIFRLDQIPDEELQLLAGRGLNALWLIGLWERSDASQTIKRLRGQHDAVASAYSLKDYRIADDLGGNQAYERLRERAAAAGLRLASDMVPNHMGIDANWVMEHPDWFISRPESPFPSYGFEGPDLSVDSRYEIKIEDHYYDQSDAAVVFRLRQRSTGHTRFVYHGNDGTTFAWNDTAQLDYSKAYVREQVIQTILHVARLFPIIRFDAAMVLAKKHVQRLWFPLPGMGGSIPSRAEDAMSQEEFDALMPNEFWREVVDRVAVEVPGTLLLAEAFWLLEGYFVRTLGMHRVYNSAFMNMLRDEENAKYRSYLKKTIEFDPEILKRYVNFMSNPDERTAIDQFGTGDKYFGTAVMLATIPGLPMFGHGQIEAFTEKYGMEYKQARFEEWPNEDLVARHMREIAPLLKRRHIFAESADFVLYDFWKDDGQVDENVFAYSNRCGSDRSLVLFNNVYGSTHGTLHTSAASMNKGSGELQQRSLTDGLALPVEESLVIAYRDVTNNLEYLRRSTTLGHDGLTVSLRGYQYAVLLHWRELRSTAEQPWDQLCDALGGAGVHSVDEALSKMRLRSVHEALRAVLAAEMLEGIVKLSHETEAPADPTGGAAAGALAQTKPRRAKQKMTVSQPRSEAPVSVIAARAERFREVTKQLNGSVGLASTDANADKSSAEQFVETIVAATRLPRAGRRAFSVDGPHLSRSVLPSDSAAERAVAVWAPVVGWALLRDLFSPEHAIHAFDDLQLRSAFAEIFSSLGLEGENAWRAAARVRILLQTQALSGANLDLQVTHPSFWNDPDVRWLAGVNESSGKTYFNREATEELLWWLQLPAATQPSDDDAGLVARLKRIDEETVAAAEAAARSGYEVVRFTAALVASTPAASSDTFSPSSAQSSKGNKRSGGSTGLAAAAVTASPTKTEVAAPSRVNSVRSAVNAAGQQGSGERDPGAAVRKAGSGSVSRTAEGRPSVEPGRNADGPRAMASAPVKRLGGAKQNADRVGATVPGRVDKERQASNPPVSPQGGVVEKTTEMTPRTPARPDRKLPDKRKQKK